jgi:hypothetical protein
MPSWILLKLLKLLPEFYGLLALEPVDCCGEAEHAHEG